MSMYPSLTPRILADLAGKHSQGNSTISRSVESCPKCVIVWVRLGGTWVEMTFAPVTGSVDALYAAAKKAGFECK